MQQTELTHVHRKPAFKIPGRWEILRVASVVQDIAQRPAPAPQTCRERPAGVFYKKSPDCGCMSGGDRLNRTKYL
jgi:hypothetical protein